MKRSTAVFMCLAFGIATAASAGSAPVRPAKKTTAAPAAVAVPGVKAVKPEAAAARGQTAVAPTETFGNPYETPLLLNAKPLMAGRP